MDEACDVGCRASIALVSYDSLGDSLLYVMMAENLQANGFHVTCIGNVPFQLREWLPQLQIRPYPARDDFESALSGYDLVIASPPRFMRDSWSADEFQRLRTKWALVCQRAPETWRCDLAEQIRSSSNPGVFAHLEPLLKCAGPIRYRTFGDESVVEITLDYMRQRMGLAHVSKHVPLTPPAGLSHRRFGKRIVVSPDSAGPEKKDWAPSRFLALCQQLRREGYDPKIVVAPANRERWVDLARGFDVPHFDGIGELAAFIYESGAVVANDSGNGHLASFLGVPTVTLYRKRNPRFHWRPDWAPGNVVCPVVSPPFYETAWRYFISIGMVMRALRRHV